MYDDKIVTVTDYSHSRVRRSNRTPRELCHHRKRAKKMASNAAYNLWDNHSYSIANFNLN